MILACSISILLHIPLHPAQEGMDVDDKMAAATAIWPRQGHLDTDGKMAADVALRLPRQEGQSRTKGRVEAGGSNMGSVLVANTDTESDTLMSMDKTNATKSQLGHEALPPTVEQITRKVVREGREGEGGR